GSRRLEIVSKPDTAVTDEDIESYPLSILGSLGGNSLLARMQGSLPIKNIDSQLTIESLLTLNDNDVYSLSIYPNPLKPSLPISVTTGKSDESILEFLSKPTPQGYFRAAEFAVFRDGQRIVLGFFEQKGRAPWTIDYENSRSFLNRSDAFVRSKLYRFEPHSDSFNADEIQDFATAQEQKLSRMLETLADQEIDVLSLPQIECHLYGSLEDKGLMTRNTDLSHFDLDKTRLHAVLDGELTGNNFFADAKLVFFKLVGRSKSRPLEDGIGMYFSQGWGTKGYRYWAKRFYNTDNRIPLTEFLNSDLYQRESYLFMRPLAGSFVAFLIEKYGWEHFIKLYKNWPKVGLPQSLGDISLSELEKEWTDYLAKIEPEAKSVVRRRRPIEPGQFQKGFCYAHEGYRIYDGYLSQKSFRSLQKLQSLGTNWISLSPFGYLRKPNQPDYFRFSFGAGSENDESLITAMLYARKLGMGVMLKPHVLMSGPGWGWPGDVKMKTEEDWRLFFERYYKWIRHYALLAEMHEMEIFCIGVELMHTTDRHQDEWRQIIAKIRQIYSGPIAYAANWWQEFEQITFWDQLDYIGLNCYYPLSDKETVTLQDLTEGVEAFLPTIEAVAHKYKKPVLLTEVGFTSTAKNWVSPHERRRGAPVSLEDQALCYKAIFESFRNKDWLHGFYWWKWPTYLEYGGARHSGFTPNGKPAEKVVEEWYSRDWSLAGNAQ
ncbi:hypothetical protein MJD09_13395, partial [bacterium]|nr:hypothetical protein [bacterium]